MFGDRKSGAASPESTTTPPAEPCPLSSMDEQPFAEGLDVGSSPTGGTLTLNRPTIRVVGQSELTISCAST